MNSQKFLPDKLFEYSTVCSHYVMIIPDFWDEFLQILDKQCAKTVEEGAPQDVIYDGLVFESMDKRQQVHDQDDLGDDQCEDRGARRNAQVDGVLFQHERSGERHDIE